MPYSLQETNNYYYYYSSYFWLVSPNQYVPGTKIYLNRVHLTPVEYYVLQFGYKYCDIS